MGEEPQYNNMVGKPLFDILSKLPSKSLLRFRCVSKLWREYIDDSYIVSVHDKQVMEDPTPIIFYSKAYKSFCFHTIESNTITNHILKAKNKVPVFEFVGLSQTCNTKFVGSCNGLVIIETNDRNLIHTFVVIHPINKQCYVLPQLPSNFMLKPCNLESCGLGFDSSTNTFKIVCVYVKPNYPCDHWTMVVHVFGTNSWRKILQVPSYRISGKAIFAHGCLHWLASYNSEDGARQVIWFDVNNEEFGLIKPPETTSKPHMYYDHPLNDHLVDLDGQVGYLIHKTAEVWVLNHKKEWMLHCKFEDHDFPDGYVEVLGCLNKAGDMLIKVTVPGSGKEVFYIYNLKNRVIHEARIDGLDLEDGCETEMVMFPNSLCDIITNSNLFKKRA